jgi:intracellular sulfur oxidation DsrE/DsrF family protein
MYDNTTENGRRNFIGKLAAGAATISLATIATPLKASEKIISDNSIDPSNPDDLFKNINGKHKVVFDVTQPHEIYPFAWPRVFLLTNQATGTPEKENSVIVVLRHTAIGYAMDNRIWEQYPIGDVFKANDPVTKQASKRNPFWKPAAGAFTIPGFGPIPIGINELQESGVKFMVCDAAMTVYSAAVAQAMGKDAAEVRKDWNAALLPGMSLVPSGVWALGRAQEKGCAYIFAG